MHPCCKGSLQTGVRIVAIVELIMAILVILVGVGLLDAAVAVGKIKPETLSHLRKTKVAFDGMGSPEAKAHAAKIQVLLNNDELSLARMTLYVLSIMTIVFGVVNFGAAVVLLTGANKRDRAYCRVWFILKAVYFVFSIISFITMIANGVEGSSGVFTIVCKIFAMLLDFYFMWVVWAFMKEVGESRSPPPYATNPYGA